MNRAEQERLTRVYRARQASPRAALYARGNPAERYILERRESATLALLQRQGVGELQTTRILDLGCGRGHRLADWLRWGARPELLMGVDLMEDFVREARTLLPSVPLAVAAGDELPFAAGSFDIVAQSMVFTSILDPQVRHDTAVEMRRVVRPGGLILWYDFRVGSPRNRDVRGIRRREIEGLFPGCTIDLQSLILAPPLARALGTHVFTVGRVLEALPFLRSHYLAAIRVAPAHKAC